MDAVGLTVEKTAFSNSSGLKRILRKASFLSRISVDGRPYRRKKLSFGISPA